MGERNSTGAYAEESLSMEWGNRNLSIKSDWKESGCLIQEESTVWGCDVVFKYL